MARNPRIHAPGLIYHVFARGNNKEPIFFGTSNYKRFLNNLERFHKSLQYTPYAYCLLPNHFHLLLKVSDITLSKIMQTLMTAYTMYINKKYQRVGHLFQGRFGSIIIEKDQYLLQVVRYIHLNSVKAGLVDNLVEYQWSSYPQYLGKLVQLPALDTAEILGMLSDKSLRQRQLFQEFTMAGIDNGFDPIKEQTRGVLGGSKFMQKLTKVSRGVRP